MVKKTSVLCAVWLAGSVGISDANVGNASPMMAQTRAFNMTMLTEILQEVVQAVASVAPFLAAQGAMPEAAALTMLGQVMQMAAELQKNKNEENAKKDEPIRDMKKTEENRKCACNCAQKTRSVHPDKINELLQLMCTAAQLPGATEDSMLFLFKKDGVRAQQEVLLRQILAEPAGRSLLFRDFFSAIRDQGLSGVNSLLDSEVIPEAFAMLCDGFKQIFGLPIWKNAFITWFNFLVDTAQMLLNAYVDTMQQGLSLFSQQYAQEYQTNPALAEAIGQANGIVQDQIDHLQEAANTIIDQQQLLIV